MTLMMRIAKVHVSYTINLSCCTVHSNFVHAFDDIDDDAGFSM